MLNEEREKEVLDLCRGMISRQSYSGEEEAAANELKEYMKTHGFDEVWTDEYGSVIGRIKGMRPGKRLLFDGHIDTVRIGRETDWTRLPFEPEIENGRLYGRGASDMKAAIAAFTAAAAYFAEDTNRNFSGEVYVAGVVHEECFEGVAARSISRRVQPDCVVIGEASDLNIKTGQRGRAEIVVETFGVPAHSANPEKGVNAVYQMCKVIEAIRTLTLTEHPVLGKGILELTDLKSDPYPGASVVPEHCRATYDRRLLTGETKESVLAPIEALLNRMMKEDPKLLARVSYAYGTETCYTGKIIEGERFFPGWLYSEQEEFIQKLLTGLKSAGFSPEITQYNFCTNGSHYAGEAGIRTFGLGPSTESLAHTIDEYCEVSQILKVTEMYETVMQIFLGQEETL